MNKIASLYIKIHFTLYSKLSLNQIILIKAEK